MLKEAMIIAAGLGTRFKPMTDKMPKPLVDVGGKTMLDWQIEMCQNAGVEKIIINCFYKYEMIEAHIKKHWAQENIILEIEEERLETGGGVKNCLKHISGERFFTINSDIVFPNYSESNPLRILFDNFKNQKCLLLVTNKSKFIGYDGNGDFAMNERVLKWQKGGDFTYLGMQIINRNNFINITEKVFSLTEIFKKLEQEEELFGAEFVGDVLDIGNMESYNLAIEYFKAK